MNIAQRRNARAGETGDLRENPPTSGIVRQDSYVQTFGSDLAGNRTWFTLLRDDGMDVFGTCQWGMLSSLTDSLILFTYCRQGTAASQRKNGLGLLPLPLPPPQAHNPIRESGRPTQNLIPTTFAGR
ncbi:hypothetical protein PR048_024203 [Dryococelus australis]|uniref:Uncharacterized protein n=1 Tax=Dryococelus australis TaxID=614101 RepID=A0ABQ9GWC2_9NEOP|nr:hypothetical protein PR048_024203 [Dryococelus australis]